jgi:hypothetical protein
MSQSPETEKKEFEFGDVVDDDDTSSKQSCHPPEVTLASVLQLKVSPAESMGGTAFGDSTSVP